MLACFIMFTHSKSDHLDGNGDWVNRSLLIIIIRVIGAWKINFGADSEFLRIVF